MAFCKNCGQEMNDNQAVCLKCGASAPAGGGVAEVDNGGFLWGLLGFCIPIVGLILYLIWMNEKPRTAKAAGLGALINVGLGIVSTIIYFIIIASMVGATY